MVKFSKQFEGQLVPEWKEAFVDYWKLKKDLKKIHLLNTPSYNPSPTKAETFFSFLRNFAFAHHGRDRPRVIQVHKKLASSASKEDVYETELRDQMIDSEEAKEFFSCLDFQLNKVNQFYKSKEKEFLDRGESLRRQIEILVDLQSAIKEQRHKGAGSRDSQEDPSITCTLACEEESNKDRVEQVDLQQDSSPDDNSDLSENPIMDSPKPEEAPKSTPRTMNWQDSKLRSLSSRSFSCHGKNLKINIPLTTPSRTLVALGDLVFEDLISPSAKKCGPESRKLHINRNRLHHAEKMIRGALMELHKGLGYLNTYRNLNMVAFVKILKKFDKVTGKEVLPIYLKVVETSYFNCSNKVMSLADEVEELLAKHFAGEDRRKALRYLRPHHRKDSHSKTFFIGLFTGCLVALFTGYVIMAHITGMYRRHGDSIYMETVYPILSMFSLMFLHLFLYGCNIFAWRKARINYSFILELCPTKELKYRDVFLICSASMTVVVGVMFAHLSMLTKDYSFTEVQAIPGLLLLAFLLVFICPLNIFYRSSRSRLLRVIRNIVLTPFYKVLMLDFFMADQLCSQVPMLRNLEYVVCYFMTGSYKTQDYGYCMRVKHYQDLAYAVSFLPYYWRAMQCARRWFDEGETSHLVNLGKYVSAMLAAGAKVAYEKERTSGWLYLVVIVSSCATVYQLYWDFVKDWGLLQPDSKNPWLRNELMLRRKFVYYLSMGLNLVLRLAWLQTVLHYSFGRVDYRVTSLFLAALEVIRRGLWNFYRLENEHLNNAGKFRAVKTVPLPFHEVDEED